MNYLEIERVEELLAGFSGKKMLVLGDSMLDRYLWGEASRISPEAPVPIVETHRQTHRLGGAANVARNIAILGGEAVLVSIRGADPEGDLLLSELQSAGLSTDGIVVDPERVTTLKTRVVARHQQILRADRESREEIHGAVLETVLTAIKKAMKGVAGIIFSDYGKGFITASLLNELLPKWREKGIPICVDPKERHFMAYRRVTVIKPNQLEAGTVYGRRISNLQTLEEVGLGLFRHLQPEAILITRGEDGMSLFTKDDRVQHFPTVGKEVFDVTGAGDTVIASLAISLAAGATLPEAVVISNHAAGRVIREVGTAVVRREEILRSFNNRLAGKGTESG
ncbi:MAG: D-glycero-beta-D-manno-heptose-7-phosphate kinase [Candidatus Eisenbacteria bacterium]|uniref:D-glycero-beta-D-manno-heptose-7-phosphate kinase n=1 Tax=Eiseniibacteriota bacterium TaxID=2212470 RepID=A0A948RWZ8_UNCEI|nr:D-glycero-beta-D-manno-heptose-7-phosphate kinase [Candidatus Eisenbacteria bacterium]MBU1948932.1 D-glycero-beta-D-manno-heptose-7-phosphate kinase [Candidatus Eisenbacteria bacterium]MBU2690582.1 D-glycero-beta-D-manno-heptose-7-phosphate kinase [Candidatus Eisenbacteria bacterium]